MLSFQDQFSKLNPHIYPKSCHILIFLDFINSKTVQSRQNTEDDSSIWFTYQKSKEYCAKHGSNQVSILSLEENSWISARILGATWLGMELSSAGSAPKKWVDGNDLTYQNWRNGAPWPSNPENTRAYIQSSQSNGEDEYFGMWANCSPDEWLKLPVCKRPALSGPINPPPEVPDIPAHPNCEPKWHYDFAKDACFYIDEHDRSFDAAEASCVGMGGHLASINSPWEQDGVVYLMGLFPSAAGKF